MRVLNFHFIVGDWPKGSVNIMRGGPWGNPFNISRPGGRRGAIEKFEAWARARPALIERAKKELFGRDLVCACAPAPCHGDVWVKLVNE